MKIWVTAAAMAVIAALIVSAGFAVQHFTRSQTEEMIALLEEAIVCLKEEDREGSEAAFDRFTRRWQSRADTWALLLHYHAIDEIDVSLARTTVLLEKEDNDATLEEMAALQECLRHFAQREDVRLCYIF